MDYNNGGQFTNISDTFRKYVTVQTKKNSYPQNIYFICPKVTQTIDILNN